MDDIIITKTWSDIDFFEVDIKFLSKYVDVIQSYYLQEFQVNNIIKELHALCNFNKSEIDIELGEYGDKNRSVLLMHICANKNGYVKFDVTVSIIDESDPVHKCSFFINSEIGLINNFIFKLKKLSSMEIGSSICLNNGNY